MRTLIIDTATKACSVALFDDGALLASCHEIIGRGHAERLLPLIAGLPDQGRAQMIMVNVGPGSFTGIRVGVAAARGLALAWKADIAGYGCLQLVAAMAAEQINQAQAIDVVMTGGHSEYFFQHFAADGLPDTDPVSVSPATLAPLLSAPIIAGDIPDAGRARHIDIIPDASKWYLIAKLPTFSPSPVYCRAPDATLPKARP